MLDFTDKVVLITGSSRGLLTRLLFARPGLLYLFTARKLLTRRGVARLDGAGA